MKAERINQDQIRFTLTADDLSSRNLDLSELAYGSEKTKALFEDMMRTAYEKFGVDFSEKSLMIEAIPLAQNALTITVTVVSGAAEVGSLFGANMPTRPALPGKEQKALPGVSVPAAKSAGKLQGKKQKKQDTSFRLLPGGNDTAIYVFESYLALSRTASLVPEDLSLKNELYLSPQKDAYLLVVHYRTSTPRVRSFVSLMTQNCSEWFCGQHAEILMSEHCRLIIRSRAIQKLSAIEHAR